MPLQIRASAPGSLMLLGEYAVLDGYPALVCGLDKRMTVTLTPRQDKTILIESAIGRYEATLNKIKVVEPFAFMITALRQFKFKQGFDLSVNADFTHQVGFGSSAAVTVATLAALHTWQNKTYKPLDLMRQARKVIHAVQKRGSGSDVAAAVFGGIVYYQPAPLKITRLTSACPVAVLYSGYKTPTPVAIQTIHKRFATRKSLYKKIMAAMGQCAVEGAKAAQAKNWRHLGEIMNIQQGLMDALGVNTQELQELIQELRCQPGILGAKISGSGLGDCVIGLGAALPHHPNAIPALIGNEGVRCAKI